MEEKLLKEIRSSLHAIEENMTKTSRSTKVSLDAISTQLSTIISLQEQTNKLLLSILDKQ